jgi:hypothetical protein
MLFKIINFITKKIQNIVDTPYYQEYDVKYMNIDPCYVHKLTPILEYEIYNFYDIYTEHIQKDEYKYGDIIESDSDIEISE